jgi:hypothetical protein
VDCRLAGVTADCGTAVTGTIDEPIGIAKLSAFIWHRDLNL